MTDDKKPKMPKKRIFVTGQDWLVERGGDFGARITTRHDPFFKEFNSISDLMEFEEKGSLPIKNINVENLDYVTAAVAALPVMEREFVRIHFFQGISIDEMALRSGIPRSKLYYLKKKAYGHLKTELQKRLGRPLHTLFKDCPICTSKHSDETNKFIMVWLKDNNWYFRGILKALKEEFGIYAQSISVVLSHIQFHMNVDREKVFQKLSNRHRSRKEEDDEPLVNLNASVPLPLKKEINDLAQAYGRSTSKIVYLLINIGLKPLRTILEAQEELYEEALVVSKELYKMKSLENLKF